VQCTQAIVVVVTRRGEEVRSRHRAVDDRSAGVLIFLVRLTDGLPDLQPQRAEQGRPGSARSATIMNPGGRWIVDVGGSVPLLCYPGTLTDPMTAAALGHVELPWKIGNGGGGARVAIKRHVPRSTEPKSLFVRQDLPC